MKKILTSLFFVPVLFLLTASITSAQTTASGFLDIWKGTSNGGCNAADAGCNLCDAVKVVVNIINDLTTFAILAAVGMTVYGAIVLMISGGSEERVKQGKKLIVSAVTGLVIVLAGWLIINTVLHLLTGRIDFPWSDIQCYNTQ